MKKLLIGVLLILSLPATSFSATKYANLGGAAGDGSEGSPWGSLAEMKAEVSTGDTVKVKGAETVSSTFYWDGGKNVSLTFWDTNPTITVGTTGSTAGINIQSGVLNISGFTFTTIGARGDGDPVIKVDVASVTIDNTIMDSYDGTGVYVKNANFIADNVSLTNGLGGHGIWIDAASATVRNSDIVGIGGANDAVFIQEGGDSALIYNNNLASNSGKSDVIVRGGTGSSLTGVRVYNNRLYGANTVSGIDIDGTGGAYEINDLLVYNNTFNGSHSGSLNDTYAAIRLNGVNNTGTPVRIYNNTVALQCSSVGGTCWKAGIEISYATGIVELKNNLVWVDDTDNGNYIYALRDGSTSSTVTDNNNIYFSADGEHTTLSTVTPGSATISGTDPLLTLPPSDVTPQAGSVAIDNGANLSAYFTTDYLGTSRPQGAAWDIGAFEMTQGGSPPADPTTPRFRGSSMSGGWR